MYARAALVALIVVVGIRVTCGAVSSVAFLTEIALAVSIFIVVVKALSALVASMVAVFVSMVAFSAREIICYVTVIALIVAVVIAVNKADIAPLAKACVCFYDMHALATNIACVVVIFISMYTARNAYLLSANVTITVSGFVNVSVSAGFAAACSQ